jgi:hypothetical protein
MNSTKKEPGQANLRNSAGQVARVNLNKIQEHCVSITPMDLVLL